MPRKVGGNPMASKVKRKIKGRSEGRPNAFYQLKSRVRKLEAQVESLNKVFSNFIDGHAFFKMTKEKL